MRKTDREAQLVERMCAESQPQICGYLLRITSNQNFGSKPPAFLMNQRPPPQLRRRCRAPCRLQAQAPAVTQFRAEVGLQIEYGPPRSSESSRSRLQYVRTGTNLHMTCSPTCCWRPCTHKPTPPCQATEKRLSANAKTNRWH
jgi:hypothetical protein